MTTTVTAVAPGRVNLIGDHTDYARGKALPMAIDLATTATFTPGGSTLRVRSTTTGADRIVGADERPAPGSLDAMMAGLLAVVGPRAGVLNVDSTLPLGAGLSSSAALLIAGALALGADERGLDLARLCQEAERIAGQDVGLLDQMAITGGTRGHAVLIDFANLSTTTLAMPDDLDVIVIHSGQYRSLASGAYAERRREVADAERMIGSLPRASAAAIDSLDNPVLRRRARHVWSESARVEAFAAAIGNDPAEAGRLMAESHRSLAELFEVSTTTIDGLVAEVSSQPGVFGARMTGGGFGGCIVALAAPGALDPSSFDQAWRVQASDGARISPSP